MSLPEEDYIAADAKPYSLIPPIDPNTVSSTASQQHQQEQEMLLLFAVPEPPISTKELTYASEADPDKNPDFSPTETPRTLWMGDLDPWLDQIAIEDLWWKILKKHVSVKLIKPKTARHEADFAPLTHSGYCFVEFDLFEDAQEALALNGQLLPDIAIPSQLNGINDPNNQKKYFRLNWASGATLSAPIVDSPEYSLFVGDLSALTTEAHLLLFFQKEFPDSVRTVRVMTDPISGKSRCFGFVRFADEQERQRALVEMNGAWFGGRPLRVALATSRSSGSKRVQDYKPFPSMGYIGGPVGPMMGCPSHFDGSLPGQMSYPGRPNAETLINPGMAASPQDFLYLPQGSPSAMPYAVNMNGQYSDPTNTTVFVGGLLYEVGEHILFTLFKHFGQILQIKIPPGKNCGFIKFSMREEAEEAILAMEGYVIGGQRIRLGWGRVSANNKRFYQRRQHQMHVQMQAAAAISIGMDPMSAYAAAAAGFPPTPPSSLGYPQIPMRLAPQMHRMVGFDPAAAPMETFNVEDETEEGSDESYGEGDLQNGGDYHSTPKPNNPSQPSPGADQVVAGLDQLSIDSRQEKSVRGQNGSETVAYEQSSPPSANSNPNSDINGSSSSKDKSEQDKTGSKIEKKEELSSENSPSTTN